MQSTTSTSTQTEELNNPHLYPFFFKSKICVDFSFYFIFQVGRVQNAGVPVQKNRKPQQSTLHYILHIHILRGLKMHCAKCNAVCKNKEATLIPISSKLKIKVTGNYLYQIKALFVSFPSIYQVACNFNFFNVQKYNTHHCC